MEQKFISPYVFAGLTHWHKVKTVANKSTTDDVIKDVCLVMGYTFEEVDNRSRVREIVYVRHAIAYWLKKVTNGTLKGIGTVFTGNRDHATILSSIETWDNLIHFDKEIMKVNDKIKEIMIRKYL